MSQKFGTVIYAPIVAGNDTDDDAVAVYGDELGRSIHHFTTEQQKAEFTAKYKSRLFGSWCVVKESSAWYEWTGTQEDGSDGDWQEIDIGGAAGSSLTIAKQWGDYATVSSVNDISLLYPLEVRQGLSAPNTPTAGAAVLSINPAAYGPQQGKSCLVKLGADLMVKGGAPTSVYCDAEIIPFGEYFSPNLAKKGINVQDTTGDDPSVTGGQLTEVMASVGFFDKAPADGEVVVWFEYADPASPLAPKILEDVNGSPVISRRQYKSGDELGDVILVCAMMATALSPIVLKVETSFQQIEKIIVDPDKTMICVNQFSKGYETSIARIEFQRRAGVQITPIIHEFSSRMLSIKAALDGISLAETSISAGEGLDQVNGFGIQNLTGIKAAISNGALTIKDNGSISDFYVDAQIDYDRTYMLRGKTMVADFSISNPNNGFIIAAYAWTKEGDHQDKLYASRNNGSIVVNAGWTLVGQSSFPELANGSVQAKSLAIVVPDNANNIAFVIYPVAAQSPNTITITEFLVGVDKQFTGYVEKSRVSSEEQHLYLDKGYSEFVLAGSGYSGIRYTINAAAAGNPMPVGWLAKGKANVSIDNTVNQVAGSADPTRDGAIKAGSDGQATVSKSYWLSNETSTDNTVTFWDLLFDVDGNETKITESERTFTVKANTVPPGVRVDIPAYTIEMEAGQRIGGRARSSKNDGAYIQSNTPTQYAVQTVFEFDEIVSQGSDDPFADIDLSQFDAVYSSGMTVTKDVFNVASVVFSIDLPSSANMVVLGAVKELPDLSVRKVNNLDWVYSNTDKTLRVSFGETVSIGRVTIGIYL